jgi:exodeoxyribonuclease V alpha subunit
VNSRALIEHLGQFQVLCGTNQQVEKGNDTGLCLLWRDSRTQSDLALPHGCPVLIGVNSPSLGLSNGDIGLALGHAPGRPAQLVLFPGLEALPINRLPEHRPAFALTIHKSQGSEWRHIAIDLPDGGGILTPNLLYTAVTRSSQSLDVYGKGMEILAEILISQ